MDRIYLDNAASTPLDPEVFEYMKPFFVDFPGNPSSTHAFGRDQRSAIEQARRLIAKLIKAKPYEIYFTSGGTEADNLAIMGSVQQGVKHIITTAIEHHAVTHPVEHLEAAGEVTVTWLKVNRQGDIDLRELEQALEQHPNALVCLMHGNNEIGTVYDLVAIGELCRQYGARFHSDTVQTMGNFELDLSALPVDFITASAHKFNGPKGVGFLFVRKGVKLTPLIQGGSQEQNLRAGTENMPSIVGMAKALEKAYGHLEAKQSHLWELKNYLKEALKNAFPGVEFNGRQEPESALPGVLNVSFPHQEDLMLLFNLDLAGVAASAGSACNSGALLGSHVLRELGASQGSILNTIRFSFGMQNTKEEIDRAVEALRAILSDKVPLGQVD